MAVERGARKEELCGDVLNALVRCDQRLQNIALALCKLKGGDKGIEPLAERELRNLRKIGLALSRRAVRTKITGSKRQLAGRRSVIGPMPRLPQQRNRNAHKQHEHRTHRQQYVLARDNRHRRRRHEHRANVADDTTHARPQIRPVRINRNGSKFRREKHHEEARTQIENRHGRKRITAIAVDEQDKERKRGQHGSASHGDVHIRTTVQVK